MRTKDAQKRSYHLGNHKGFRGSMSGTRDKYILFQGFPGSSDSNESTCNAGGLGLIPESESSPGEGNGNPPSILSWRIPWTEESCGL